MNVKKINTITSIVITAMISGCAFNVNPYGVSVSNVEAIKSQKIPKIAVSRFNASVPGRNSVSCRGTGVIQTPNGLSFESYIEKALIDELKLADAYDPNSSYSLEGNLDSIDSNASVGTAYWTINLTVKSKNEPGYTISTRHSFSANWIGDKACQQVAQAFGPAVQKAIFDVVSDPRFKSIAR
jgi:hypothetical protein